MEPHRPQFSTQTGRRRQPPTQSPAKRVCVGEEERWSELCPAGRSEGYEIRDDKVARRELRPATQILRAGNTAKSNKYASPVMGVLEGGRHGGGEALPNRRLRPTPSGSQGELPQRGKRGWPGPLVTFWPSRKSLAARRRRNSPARNETALSSPSHPSRLRRATFPPRGRLLRGAPSSAPFGGT